MKCLITCIILFVGAISVPAIIVLPPTMDTNSMALFLKVNAINAALQNYSYQNGRVDRLQAEVDRLEMGFVCLAVIIASTFAAACSLVVLDKIRERGRKEFTKTIPKAGKTITN